MTWEDIVCHGMKLGAGNVRQLVTLCQHSGSREVNVGAQFASSFSPLYSRNLAHILGGFSTSKCSLKVPYQISLEVCLPRDSKSSQVKNKD